MYLKLRKSLLTLLAIAFAAAICCIAAFALNGSAERQAFAEENFQSQAAAQGKTTIDLSDGENFHWMLYNYDAILLSGFISEEDGVYKYYSENDEEGTRTEVIHSIVRDRKAGARIILHDALDADGLYDAADVYTITYEGEDGDDFCYGAASGKYTAKATIILKDSENYELVKSQELDPKRLMSVEIAADGKSAVITKEWYIVSIDNGILSQHGESYGKEWEITDWTYGDYKQQYAPRLEHGDKDSDYGEQIEFEPEDIRVTFDLYIVETKGGKVTLTQIGTTFNRYHFDEYINESMPVDSYLLQVHVDTCITGDTHKHWYDEEDNTQHDSTEQDIYFDSFESEFSFAVKKARFAAGVNVDELNGKVYNYTYDGNLHLYDETFTLNAPVKFSTREERKGVWKKEIYDSFYGKAELLYTLHRWNPMTFVTEDGFNSYVNDRQKPVGADKDSYLISYKLVAPNYYDLGGDVEKYFTVTITPAALEIPAAVQKTYNGSAHIYEVGEDAPYTVTGNSAFTNAGSYNVTLELKREVQHNYVWKNEDGTISDAAKATAKMIINKARISVPEKVTAKLKDEYVYTVAANEMYEVVGDNTFTQLGSYEITLKLKNSDNYEWMASDGSVLQGDTATTTLTLITPSNGNAVAIIVLCVILGVVVLGSAAFLIYYFGFKHRKPKSEK